MEVRIIKHCLDFDGIDDYIQVAHNTSFNFTISDNWTIEGWIKTDSEENKAILYKRANGGDYQGYNVLMYGGRIDIGLRTSGSAYKDFTTDVDINDGVWHYFAWVHPANAQTKDDNYVYIDGVLRTLSIRNSNGTVTTITNTDPLMIGSAEGGNIPWDGLINKVRIYNRALSVSEIKESYKKRYVSRSGLVAEWNMDEGSGDTIEDSSDNDNVGNIVGATWTDVIEKDYIEKKSLKIENILTSQVDNCSFNVLTDTMFKPVVGDEVKVYDGDDKIFAGHIARVTEGVKAVKLYQYKCQCKDYTNEMDGKLVIGTYSNKTVNEIISDIVVNYCDGDGYSLEFDGIDDYVELGDNFPEVTTGGTYSISLWFNTANIAQAGTLINISPGAASADRNGINLSGSYVRGGYWNGSAYVGKRSLLTGLDNKWNHVVLINNSGTISLYLNGVGTDITGISSLNAENKIGLNASAAFTGKIDKGHIYNRALTAAEVENLYKGTPPTSGLIAEWNMNEGTGSTIEDTAGSNDGTIYGATWSTETPSIEDIFTVHNVNCSNVVNHIAFNYEQPSKCLQILAKLVGYDWYIDYDRDIHFFSKETDVAPFYLTDTGANYIYNSLKIKRDNSQLKNVIFVRGGEYLGDVVTAEIEADGNSRFFPTNYKFDFDDIKVRIDAAVKTVGVDFTDDPDSYDCLHNFNEKVVKFRENNKPADGEIVKVSGKPYIPVIVRSRSQESINANGERQYKIIDKSIKTKDSARERGVAELESYKNSLSEGSFITHKKGLRSGQLINISSAFRNINEDFLINRVTMTVRGVNTLWYQVFIVSVKTFGMIEFLQKLLMAENRSIVIGKDEIIDILWSVEESMAVLDDDTPSTSYQAPPWYTKGTPQTEPLGVVGFCEAT